MLVTQAAICRPTRLALDLEFSIGEHVFVIKKSVGNVEQMFVQRLKSIPEKGRQITTTIQEIKAGKCKAGNCVNLGAAHCNIIICVLYIHILRLCA